MRGAKGFHAMHKQIVAIPLLTSDELALLGSFFYRAYPVNDAPCFVALLAAIDDAHRDLWRADDRLLQRKLSNVLTTDADGRY